MTWLYLISIALACRATADAWFKPDGIFSTWREYATVTRDTLTQKFIDAGGPTSFGEDVQLWYSRLLLCRFCLVYWLAGFFTLLGAIFNVFGTGWAFLLWPFWALVVATLANLSYEVIPPHES